MNSLEKSRNGLTTWLAAMSVAATLAVGGVSVAQAQQAEPAAAPAAAPATDAAAPAMDAAAPATPATPAADAAPAAGLAADAKVEQENISGPERLW